NPALAGGDRMQFRSIQTARVHHAARRRGGGVAARGAGTAAEENPEALLSLIRTANVAVDKIWRLLLGTARTRLCSGANHNHRFLDRHAERFSALATECLRLKGDIIATGTTPATQAAKDATRSIPIVMVSLLDPVGTGLVDSLARPGGNVTGVSSMGPTLAIKRLELLKELVPQLSRVLVLTYLADPVALPQVRALEETAHSLGLKLQIRDVRTAQELPAAFDAGAKELAEGVITTA